MTTGEKIRAARKKRGLSLRELGEAVGLHFTTVRKLEASIMRPTMLHVEAIAKALGISAYELHAEAGEAEPMIINGILQPSAVIVNGVRYEPVG